MQGSLIQLLLLCSSTFTAVLGRNDFPNEIVVTSADVVDGQILNVGNPGENYRLYAVYQVGGGPDSEVRKITITDGQGSVYNLANLCGIENQYFLSENNVVGPVTVKDPTSHSQEAQNRAKRSVAWGIPYTIYLVSTKVPIFPVADSRTNYPRISINSDDYNKGQEVKGLTILTADAHVSLRAFEITQDAYIVPRGYDLSSTGTQDSIIDLNQQNAAASYFTLFGPIATILNKDQTKTGRFKIGFDLASTYGPIDPGAALTLLSPNYLSLDGYYTSSYTKFSEAFDRQFDFGKDTLLNLGLAYAPLKNGESIQIDVKTEKGDTRTWTYSPTANPGTPGAITGKTIHVKTTVTDLAKPETYPRFMVKVTSVGEAKPDNPETTTSKVETTTSKMETTTPKVDPSTTSGGSAVFTISSLLALLLVF